MSEYEVEGTRDEKLLYAGNKLSQASLATYLPTSYFRRIHPRRLHGLKIFHLGAKKWGICSRRAVGKMVLPGIANKRSLEVKVWGCW